MNTTSSFQNFWVCHCYGIKDYTWGWFVIITYSQAWNIERAQTCTNKLWFFLSEKLWWSLGSKHYWTIVWTISKSFSTPWRRKAGVQSKSLQTFYGLWYNHQWVWSWSCRRDEFVLNQWYPKHQLIYIQQCSWPKPIPVSIEGPSIQKIHWSVFWSFEWLCLYCHGSYTPVIVNW